MDHSLFTTDYSLLTIQELTATGIAPELHRTSLLISHIARTKYGSKSSSCYIFGKLSFTREGDKWEVVHGPWSIVDSKESKKTNLFSLLWAISDGLWTMYYNPSFPYIYHHINLLCRETKNSICSVSL